MPAPLDLAILAFLRGSDDLPAAAARIAAHGAAAAALVRLEAELTPEETAALRAAAAPALARTLQLGYAARAVDEVLDAAGIRRVALKGPVLAELWRARDGADTRTYNDLDILVSPADAPTAQARLVDAGWRLGPASAGEVTLLHDSGAALDLHWLAINDAGLCRRFRLDTDELFERHVRWDGLRGRFDPTMTLLHTSLHAVISDVARLAAVYDVDAAAREITSWDEVLTLTDERGMSLLLTVALDRARLWLHSPVPAYVVDALPRGPWVRAMRWFAARAPERHIAGRWSGSALARRTRESTVRSALALLADGGTLARTQLTLTMRQRSRVR